MTPPRSRRRRSGWLPLIAILILEPTLSERLPGGEGVAIAQQRQRTPRARRRLAAQLVQRGLRLMAERKFAEAASAFAEAQRTYPSQRSLFLLGQAHDRAGDADAARRAYARIPARARERIAAELKQRGLESMAKGKHGSAIADFELAAKLSASGQPRLLLAQAQELAGQLVAARKTYQGLLGEVRGAERKLVEKRLAVVEQRIKRQRPEDRKPESQPTQAESPQIALGDRRDDDILGDDEKETTPKPTGEAGHGQVDREKRLLGIGTDKMQIGGAIYTRFNFRFTDGDRSTDHPFSMPNFADIFLDAQPSDRLRGFLVTRLSFNPSIDETDPVNVAAGTRQFRISLNEFWLKFDLARRVYFTIGQQMVRWGATKIWNPIDVINLTKRPVLSPVDERPGVMMVKLQVPVESLGWNFYAAALLDGASTLDRWGVTGRAELVFSTVELGLTGAYRKSVDPKLGLDLSAGVWDFDLMAEAGLRISDRFEGGVALQIAGGLQYTIGVFDNDQLILLGEYFYNQEGSSRPDPFTIYQGTGQGFYLGRHYAALMISLPGPGRLDDWSFAAKGVGNFSDSSFVAQLQVGVNVLSGLGVQAILAGHFGKQGELRLGDLAFPAESVVKARALYSPKDPTRFIPVQTVDFSLWLNLAI